MDPLWLRRRSYKNVKVQSIVPAAALGLFFANKRDGTQGSETEDRSLKRSPDNTTVSIITPCIIHANLGKTPRSSSAVSKMCRRLCQRRELRFFFSLLFSTMMSKNMSIEKVTMTLTPCQQTRLKTLCDNLETEEGRLENNLYTSTVFIRCNACGSWGFPSLNDGNRN